MIEMLGVLAIIGILSAGGIMGYSTAMENYKANKIAKDINTFMANARTYFNKINNSGIDVNLNTTQLCQIGVITDEYCTDFLPNDDSNVKGPFDIVIRFYTHQQPITGKYYIPEENTAISFNAMNEFSAAIHNLSLSVCVKLLTRKWDDGIFIYPIAVTGVLRKAYLPPFNPSTAETICRATRPYSGLENYNFHIYGFLDYTK